MSCFRSNADHGTRKNKDWKRERERKIARERERERRGENNQMIGNKNAKLKSRIFFKKKNSVTSFDE